MLQAPPASLHQRDISAGEAWKHFGLDGLLIASASGVGEAAGSSGASSSGAKPPAAAASSSAQQHSPVKLKPVLKPLPGGGGLAMLSPELPGALDPYVSAMVPRYGVPPREPVALRRASLARLHDPYGIMAAGPDSMTRAASEQSVPHPWLRTTRGADGGPLARKPARAKQAGPGGNGRRRRKEKGPQIDAARSLPALSATAPPALMRTRMMMQPEHEHTAMATEGPTEDGPAAAGPLRPPQQRPSAAERDPAMERETGGGLDGMYLAPNAASGRGGGASRLGPSAARSGGGDRASSSSSIASSAAAGGEAMGAGAAGGGAPSIPAALGPGAPCSLKGKGKHVFRQQIRGDIAAAF